MAEFHPKRRQTGLKVEDFQGETLVYDLEHHTAHCLNGAAVRVWQHADGTLTVAEITARIAAEGVEIDEDVVWRALAELDAASLLDTPLEPAVTDPSRRALFMKIGWAAAVPLVLSVAVPKPAYAQSVITGPAA